MPRLLLPLLVLVLAGCPPVVPELDCDRDQDGHLAQGECGGADCDDADAAVHPGADELCDLLDRDCDGLADVDSVDAPTWWTDADADGYGDEQGPLVACEQPAGSADNAEDCDDGDADVGPPRGGYPDLDEDLFGDSSADGWMTTCDSDPPLSTNDNDCDDTDPAVHPGADEACNGVDDDCDGEVDEATWWRDSDGDGYGADPTTHDCDPGDGWADNDSDCDDGDAAVHPGAEEICANGLDDDCDGLPVGCGVYGDCLASDLADLTLYTPGWFFPFALTVIQGLCVDDDRCLLASAMQSPDWRVLAGDGAGSGLRTLDAEDAVLGRDADWYGLGTSLTLLGDTGGAAGPDLAVGRPGEVLVYDLPLSGSGDASEFRAMVYLSDTEEWWDQAVVASGGDLNGDGVQDLLLGQPQWSDMRGRVLVFLGPLAGTLTDADADATLVGEGPTLPYDTPTGDLVDAGDGVGATLAPLGDMDGDGYDEFAVGVPGWNRGGLEQGGIDVGAVLVFSGPLLGAVPLGEARAALYGEQGRSGWTCPEERGGDDDDSWPEPCAWDDAASFAGALLATGDTDADGVLELLQGQVFGPPPLEWEAEVDLAVVVHEGPWLGEVEADEASARLELLNGAYGDHWGGGFGARLLTPDLDGSGTSDVVLGRSSPSWDPGPVWVEYGPLPGETVALGSDADALLRQAEEGELDGALLAGGDLDGDGYDDLAIGARSTHTVLVLRGGPGM